MTEETITPGERYKKILANAIIIGVLCGLALCAIFLVFNVLWSGVFDHDHYNYQLDTLKNTQYYVVLFFIPLMSGILSAAISAPYARGISISAVSGAIAGAVLGIFASALFAINTLSDIPIEGVFLIILVCTIIATASAFIFTTITSYEIDDNFDFKSVVKPLNRKNMIIAIVAIFILLLMVPPVFGFTGVNTGLIHRAPHDGITIGVTVQRLSDDSILITNHGGPGAYWLKDNGAFIIEVNGKNVTNMDAIVQSGLSVSISPAEGLGTSEGSSVKITGSDIAPRPQDYGGNSTYVFAICITNDGYKQVVLETYV